MGVTCAAVVLSVLSCYLTCLYHSHTSMARFLLTVPDLNRVNWYHVTVTPHAPHDPGANSPTRCSGVRKYLRLTNSFICAVKLFLAYIVSCDVLRGRVEKTLDILFLLTWNNDPQIKPQRYGV